MRLYLVVFLVACGSKPQPPVTSLPPGTVRPDIGSGGNLGSGRIAVSCDATQRSHPCDAAPYSLSLAADTVTSCTIRGSQLTLQLGSANAPVDAVLLDMDSFNGPGTYPLDDPYKRFLRVTSRATAPTCVNGTLSGPPEMGTRVVTGPGIGCASPACSVEITMADPAAPSPKQVGFHVHCDTLCESNSALVCQPATDFTVEASCTSN